MFLTNLDSICMCKVKLSHEMNLCITKLIKTQEWPPQVEDILRETGIPTADFECDVSTYVDIICTLLDIPVHKSRIQSLHVFFSLFSAFKHSQHFNQLAQDNNNLDLDNSQQMLF